MELIVRFRLTTEAIGASSPVTKTWPDCELPEGLDVEPVVQPIRDTISEHIVENRKILFIVGSRSRIWGRGSTTGK
jgi:hypothetical protein